MHKDTGGITSNLLGGLCSCLRRCIFGILSMGPVPNHIAFIMDGNRRFAKKTNLAEGIGHKAGFSSLISMLRYCYELGVKYVTFYAFSIDNFKRKPKEVQSLMELMREKIEELLQDESIINEYGVKLHFIGNLQLLAEPVRISMEKAMKVTAHNKQRVLLVCVAYTSSDEIVHAVEESFKEIWNATVSNGTIGQLDRSPKRNGIRVNAQDSCEDYARQDADGSTDRSGKTETSSCNGMVEIAEEGKHDQGELPAIKLTDVEKNMYMAVAPDPDILIRTSGEVRLSNFLLWQTSTCPLYSPAALWPEIGLRHLVWAVLNFQRHHSYLEKKKKQF